MVYQIDKDTSLSKEDHFGPLSTPSTDFMALPDSVKVEMISTENDIAKLEVLLEEEFIGVDSEWRPQLTQLHKTKPSLF